MDVEVEVVDRDERTERLSQRDRAHRDVAVRRGAIDGGCRREPSWIGDVESFAVGPRSAIRPPPSEKFAVAGSPAFNRPVVSDSSSFTPNSRSARSFSVSATRGVNSAAVASAVTRAGNVSPGSPSMVRGTTSPTLIEAKTGAVTYTRTQACRASPNETTGMPAPSTSPGSACLAMTCPSTGAVSTRSPAAASPMASCARAVATAALAAAIRSGRAPASRSSSASRAASRRAPATRAAFADASNADWLMPPASSSRASRTESAAVRSASLAALRSSARARSSSSGRAPLNQVGELGLGGGQARPSLLDVLGKSGLRAGRQSCRRL